jgi:hypothetical protein
MSEALVGSMINVAKQVPWKDLAKQYGPQIASMAMSTALPKIRRGLEINQLHERNRKLCGFSKKEYRRLGGYKSRTPLCQRQCYRQKGKCNGD